MLRGIQPYYTGIFNPEGCRCMMLNIHTVCADPIRGPYQIIFAALPHGADPEPLNVITYDTAAVEIY